MDWSTGDYAFAQEYAAWGWFKSEATCDADQEIFRVVIDTADEGDNSGANPNFASGTWTPDFN